jgi:hypothetical protein
LSHDRSIETTNDDLVSFAKDAIGKHNINCSSKPLNYLDLKHRAFELRQIHQAITHALLSEVDEEHDHVGNTLSCNGRSGNKRHVAAQVLVIVVEAGVQSFFSEGDDSLRHSVFKLALHGSILLRERFAERAVRCRVPAVYTIDLEKRLMEENTKAYVYC